MRSLTLIAFTIILASWSWQARAASFIQDTPRGPAVVDLENAAEILGPDRFETYTSLLRARK